MQNIVFVIGTLGNGGAERVISVLSNEFARRNYKVSIVCIYGKRIDYEIDPNIKVTSISCNSKNRVMRLLDRCFKLRSILKEEKPKVIISFLADVNIYTIVATLFTKRKIIISERNDPYNDPKNPILRLVRNILYEFADGFVFQTPDAKLYFSSRICNKSTIIGNPLKEGLPDRFEGKRKKEIVAVSRLSKQKNLFLLLDAFNIFLRVCPDYKLIVYGEGPLKSSLENKIRELSLNEKVYMPGYSTNVHDLIRDSAMFVLSSDYEGISNSMLEALALGVPVISTDCPIGGSRLYIESYVNGILIPVRDVNALAKAMIKLAENEDLSQRLSVNATRIRELLSVRRIADEWEIMISNVTKKQSGLF